MKLEKIEELNVGKEITINSGSGQRVENLFDKYAPFSLPLIVPLSFVGACLSYIQ